MSDERRGTDDDERSNTGVVVKPRPKVKKPSMYKVLMLNDDYTPMEFVVHVLERFFGKNTE
ncbi:MAG: ATP-dependent Clp protease adaptor ClpS, partial [Rhodospirillaceae bacterium]